MSENDAKNLPTGEGPVKEEPETTSLPVPEGDPHVKLKGPIAMEALAPEKEEPVQELPLEEATEYPANIEEPKLAEVEAPVVEDASPPQEPVDEAEVPQEKAEADAETIEEAEAIVEPVMVEEEASAKAVDVPVEVEEETIAENVDVPVKVAEEAIAEDVAEVDETVEKPVTDAVGEPAKEVEEIINEPVAEEAETALAKATDDSDAKLAKEEASVLIPADHPVEEDEDHHEAEEIPEYSSMGKEELVVALEELVAADDINPIKKRVSMIRLAFNEIQSAAKASAAKAKSGKEEAGDEVTSTEPAPADPLVQRFSAAFALFKEKRARQAAEHEKQKAGNLLAKNVILEELRVLVASEESLKITYDKFRDLQQSWKEIGMIPRNEVANLWQNYHFLVEKFFDKVRINKELRDLDLKKNLEEKIHLCEKAEELILETSISRSFKMLQQYHQEWKAIGPVPHEYKDEIWERFKSATEKINQRRRDYYVKSHDEQVANLAAKTALCEKVDELLLVENKSIKEWNTRTDEVKEFFKLWKSIGPAPKKENDVIWERFKSSVDRFYSEKSEFFGKLKEEQTHNYNLKLDICTQAEALKDSSDWKATTHAFINLQKEWKNIGPVPRRNADKIWKRFRSACDEFFNRKTEFFANIKGHEKENLTKKENLIEEVAVFKFSKDKTENLNVLKDFQRKWMDIGHVPIREKDKIQAKFRETVDKRMKELQISSSEIAEMSYRSRIDKINESPDADRLFDKERYQIQNKISKIQADINLWENNLGFLASSKKADILKKEFESKIEKAKNEVALLKAKLRVLRNS